MAVEWKFECQNCDWGKWTSTSVNDTKCPTCGFDSTKNWTGEKA